MFQDHSESDTFTVHKRSPWPLVGGMLALAGLVSTLLLAFAN